MKTIKCNRSIAMEKTDNFIETVVPGEEIFIETINAFGDSFENLSELETLMSMHNPPHHHPLTGPIYIEGANPGDFLKVHIESIKLKEMAQMLSKSAGISPLEANESFNFSNRFPVISKLLDDENRNLRYFKNQIELVATPCIGMIATMPSEGKIKTGHIGVTGGNFDNPFISEGVDIYLPVQVKGAGLYIGDVHAKQAYGELSGIALEASADVKLKVSILKPWIPFMTDPIFIMGKEPLTKQNSLAVIGIGSNFKNGDEAVRDAFFKTIEVIQRLKPTMSEMMIRSLLSLIGNSMAGQAYSNTSESTSQILLTEENLRAIYKSENPNILNDLEMCLFKDVDVPSNTKTIITIGAVKGRLQKVLHKYIESLGIKIPKINPRLLVYDIETEKYILRIHLLKWKDITKNYSKFDLVIYGADKWLENSNKAFVALKHFEQKDCRMSILVPNELKEYPLSYFLQRNIATTYPNVLKQNYQVSDNNIVEMEGSVEASIKLGWADSIFDVVETGETAIVNGLVEHTEVVKFGAVLSTARIDKLPLFVNLGLIEPINEKICIAFDGIDGSGKSTLAKIVVQTGLFKNSQVVLVEPFSGKVGKDAFSLWQDEKYLLWAQIVGMQHWSARNIVNTVYDRSIITALVDNLAVSEEDALQVLNAWTPLPDILFYCKIDAKIAYERNSKRKNHDEFETLESLEYYEKLYEKAVSFLKENTNVKVVEIDASRSTQESIQQVKETLQNERFD